MALLAVPSALVRAQNDDASALLAIDRLRARGLPELAVRSEAFAPGEPIPFAYTAEGGNIAPPIYWTPGPPATRSYVLIAETRAAGPHRLLWLVYDIPAEQTALGAGARLRESRARNGPVMARGKNSLGTLGFAGPRPTAAEGMLRYHFQVFALDTVLRVSEGASFHAVIGAMRDHVLAAGELIGTFSASGSPMRIADVPPKAPLAMTPTPVPETVPSAPEGSATVASSLPAPLMPAPPPPTEQRPPPPKPWNLNIPPLGVAAFVSALPHSEAELLAMSERPGLLAKIEPFDPPNLPAIADPQPEPAPQTVAELAEPKKPAPTPEPVAEVTAPKASLPPAARAPSPLPPPARRTPPKPWNSNIPPMAVAAHVSALQPGEAEPLTSDGPAFLAKVGAFDLPSVPAIGPESSSREVAEMPQPARPPARAQPIMEVVERETVLPPPEPELLPLSPRPTSTAALTIAPPQLREEPVEAVVEPGPKRPAATERPEPRDQVESTPRALTEPAEDLVTAEPGMLFSDPIRSVLARTPRPIEFRELPPVKIALLEPPPAAAPVEAARPSAPASKATQPVAAAEPPTAAQSGSAPMPIVPAPSAEKMAKPVQPKPKAAGTTGAAAPGVAPPPAKPARAGIPELRPSSGAKPDPGAGG